MSDMKNLLLKMAKANPTPVVKQAAEEASDTSSDEESKPVETEAANPTTDEEVKTEEAKPEPEVAEEKPEEQVKLEGADEKQTRFLSEEMNKMLNEQISFEMFSAYLYFMISAWSQSKGLTGFQAHFDKQGHGEIGHAMKIYKYLVDTGAKVDLPAIPSPTGLIKSSNMQEACRAALDHEMVVTDRWTKIGNKAKTENSIVTIELAQWFLTEQIEEEDLSLTLLQKVEMADNGAGLLIIDAGLK